VWFFLGVAAGGVGSISLALRKGRQAEACLLFVKYGRNQKQTG
jgi:hypothetical protein